MELPDPVYLYTLATLAMTFAALVVIFMSFRQIRGGSLSKFEVFMTKSFLHLSFIVVAGSLLPALLAHLGIPPRLAWRQASAATAAIVVEHVGMQPKRRRAITNVRAPLPFIAASSLLWAAALALVANAAGLPFPPGPGLYALGVTLPLFVAIWALLRRVTSLLTNPEADFDPAKA